MADIANIPTQVMIDDYYASWADRKVLMKLHANPTEEQQKRIDGNKKIMDTVRAELNRRGELPNNLPR